MGYDNGIDAGHAFVAGVDFDPSDPEEVEIVLMVSELSAETEMRHLRDENAFLRTQLAELGIELY